MKLFGKHFHRSLPFGSMAALGLDQVLELANEYDAQGNEGRGEGAERERRRGRGQARRQPLGRGLRQRNQRANLQARRAGARFAVKKRQLVLQSEHFTKTGQARTQDHQLPDAELSRKVATGKGKWKTWTPEAVLRAGFGHETATCRQVASEVEGASASHSRNARFACASAACRFQEQSCEKVAADSLARPLKFFIRSLMFDESSFALKVGTDPANSCSVLCSHAQWAMASPPNVAGGQPTIRDEHVVRPPQILAPMNSATMWKTLSEHPGGLGPCSVAAEHTCTLTTCDSHSANIKMLKHFDSTLPADHLFLPTLCAQHRNGNVVEQLTHLLGNLSGCFCVSRVLNSRHAVQALRRRTRAALERDLVFLESEPVGVQAEWAEARSLTRRFLKMAAMFDAAAKKDDDSAADAAAAGEAQVELPAGRAQLLDFFNGPWSGLPLACVGWATAKSVQFLLCLVYACDVTF